MHCADGFQSERLLASGRSAEVVGSLEGLSRGVNLCLRLHQALGGDFCPCGVCGQTSGEPGSEFLLSSCRPQLCASVVPSHPPTTSQPTLRASPPSPLPLQASRLASSRPSIGCQRGSDTASPYVDLEAVAAAAAERRQLARLPPLAVAATAERRQPVRLRPPLVVVVALAMEPATTWALMDATCGPSSAATATPAALAKAWAAAAATACSLTGWKYARGRIGVRGRIAAVVTCSPSGQ